MAVEELSTSRQYTDIPRGDVSEYHNTQRVKTVRFDRPYAPEEITGVLLDAWNIAGERYPTPLAQVRAIMPVSQEPVLLEQLAEVSQRVSDSNVAVVGRVPFKVNRRNYGLYYCHAESPRPAFPSSRSHEASIQYGLERRARRQEREFPSGFNLQVVEFANAVARNPLSGETTQLDMRNLAQQLVALHKICFAYPHDPSQQTEEGMMEILSNNPVAFITDPNNQIASAVLLERDDRFTFGNIALVEPTYFTHPGGEYREHGLSSFLRDTVQRLVQNSSAIESYRRDPILLFTESIRHISFHLCLETGFPLAGDGKVITGNLGNYTLIGDANPDTGYMPMGLTYYRDPRLGGKMGV